VFLIMRFTIGINNDYTIEGDYVLCSLLIKLIISCSLIWFSKEA